ncbi:2-phospho-L-lactate transferase [Seongchinamella sediminis]|uniref:2-phospho-L-lactate transferase n=1 Tax=Seongchinamella sediminis TaxID=2283635 RepID=A0A3L7DVZ7_9GAMM|nr:2-phospho-L-lactate transferase [Seongchinamella sediminis]RLQ21484.1 2-phospho-L-lactate transferase [Seongchinamella sediminis]
MLAADTRVLALTGGVGGAKLCLGLDCLLPAGALQVLVNTGDDFEHLGLHISPDIDTLLYTLAGRSNQAQGWGLEGESWNAMAALEELGGSTWFRLGDRDLATHLFRTARLAAGDDLARVTAELAQRLGIASGIHPMSSQPVRTTVHSDEGDLPFQHYFVRRQCEPQVSGFSFEGIAEAAPNPALVAMLAENRFSHVLVCPSNPFVSIDPILQLPGLWSALRDCDAPVILVSPIVAGQAIKGPAAKMMAELQVPVTATGVARHYASHYPGLVDYFLIDESDATLAGDIDQLGLQARVAPTLMKTLDQKIELARHCLALEAR